VEKKKTTIGIWGLGETGKSAIDYFSQDNFQLQVMDKKILSKQEQNFLTKRNVTYIDETKGRNNFFSCNQFLFSSPGIDIKKYYATYQQKWLNELDLFYQNFNRTIIAITGSVGKTSITQLLGQLLVQYRMNIIIGGNIGTPPLALLNQKNFVDIALLEVSSFQLAYCKKFAPDIAIWTNFYPNHLDWHDSIKNYFEAKYRIITHQHSKQKALLPFNLLQKIKKYKPHPQYLSFFSSHRPTNSELKLLQEHNCLYFIDQNYLLKYKNGIFCSLITINKLPSITFQENWLIVCSALDILNLPLSYLPKFTKKLTIPEHRLEKVAKINGVDFYNDSKSTTPASTFAAVKTLSSKPIFLFLGGLSKGIKRKQFIKSLKNYVTFIYCFGNEATSLSHFCKEYEIPATAYTNLDHAFTDAIQQIRPGSVLLFSPAGSSFDLFANYQERGNYFKNLVNNYIINQNKKNEIK
jgi:UDP-N-acetylmuramoylalanine--D-glutamate ligase